MLVFMRWGLYYWVVKLKDGTDPKVKAEFAKWYQNKDDICTGYLQRAILISLMEIT